ncbi:immunity protein sdpi [Anaeramoeba ignava]|uniref:Immunity protein sdpi n=1 Tax=Anaeramoeba ignava TaxID=1746090 RepID=A0A9Q0LW07_ANAIG|nr:immunity protein sdpi [Anaeramoeba ignava]
MILSILILFLFFLSILQSLYYFYVLPDQVAVHYNFKLEPDWISSKKLLIGSYLIVSIAIFVLFKFLTSFLFQRGRFKVPNKEYWFSEERKQKTIEKAIKYFEVFHLILLLFLLVLFQIIFMENLSNHQLSWFWVLWVVIAGYLVLVFIWSYFYSRAFRLEHSKQKQD